MASSSDDYDIFEDAGLGDADVVTKYRLAGDMATRVITKIASEAVDGASVRSLCEAGDAELLRETAAVYNKKIDGRVVAKGIAFPTCISVNNCICHFSPLVSDPDVVLKAGDVVKIDLGAHVDGYIGVAATTVVVGASADAPVTGRKADVVLAAYNAAEAALRLVKNGASSDVVTAAIQQIATDFGCKPVEGMLSHQLKRNRIDGDKAIIQNPSEAQRKEHKDCTFETNEVYAIDIIMSTGEGKAKQGEERTTVYKKTTAVYQLKMKASRAFFSEATKKCTTMPFTLRAFEDEKKARMGVVECVSHGVVEPFHVLYEKDGEFVAQFKLVVLVMPNGNIRATTSGFDPACFKSDHEVTDEELKKVLSSSVGAKKKKKKKAGKGDEAAAAAAE